MSHELARNQLVEASNLRTGELERLLAACEEARGNGKEGEIRMFL